MNERLVNDVAEAMARVLLDLVKPCLREEEWQAARDEFFHVCKKGVESYEIQVNRMERRLKPLKN